MTKNPKFNIYEEIPNPDVDLRIHVLIPNISWTFASVMSCVNDIVESGMIPANIRIAVEDYHYFNLGHKQALISGGVTPIMKLMDQCKQFEVTEEVNSGAVTILCQNKKVEEEKEKPKSKKDSGSKRKSKATTSDQKAE